VRPDLPPTGGANWDEDRGAGEFPNTYYFYLPRMCNHCSNPACVAACPSGAIEKRPQDGIVLVNPDRCRGYRYCIASCPYKKVYFNEQLARSEKCIFCYPRVEKGLAPACAQQCPGRVRFVGYRDDEDGPVHQLVDRFKVALPLHAEWGTEPNVFYVPPLSPPTVDAAGKPGSVPRIPTEYLRELFGPDVDRVLATLEEERSKKAAGGTSEVLDILIAYEHAKMFKLV
jgi:dimethylsulfide dehydrogenase subunit beta/complex iron-sulfur molybdoenzyme family reductase subunit beta